MEFRMIFKCLLLMLVCFLPDSNGFFAEFFDAMEDVPIRFVSGTCFLLLDGTYKPGEFEMIVKTDKPTVDIYSWNFISFDRQFHGTSYRMLNLQDLKEGLQMVRFSVAYFGSRRYSPRAWCQQIPITPTPPPSTTTTIKPSTATTITSTTTTTTTTSTKTPTTTEPSTTTSSTTTSTTTPSTTTTQSTTTSTAPSTTTTTPSTTTPTTTTSTTTLGAGPIRPSPS